MGEILIKREDFKDYLIKEIPVILQENPEVSEKMLVFFQKKFADREKTEDRIDRVLDELKRDREYNERRWREQKLESDKKWEEHKLESDKKWEEQKLESDKKWEEHRLESDKKWREQKLESDKKWKEHRLESDKKWEESRRQFEKMMQEIKDLRISHNKIDELFKNTMGALGSRWGLQSESAFRNGLKAILEDRFKVKVENINLKDEEGFVFNRPDQVEIDVIIFNGDIIACEIKSSMSHSDMYTFNRKVLFYEKLHNCNVTTKMVISPMVDGRAYRVADELGIKVYSSSDQVTF